LVSEDITISIVRMSTGELISMLTWEDITIPSGGSRILQSGSLVLEPYDLRLLLDPVDPSGEGGIRETNELNNVYETPVRIRVEFVQAYAPNCNETSCSIFDCDAEHVFHVWAGHGPEGGPVNWVGDYVRFPESGVIRICGRERCDEDPDWSMEGDARYIFEFEMPASDAVHVLVTGEEQDGPTHPDSLGSARGTYNRAMNYGADGGTYTVSHGSETPCDDPFCRPCPHGLSAQWRITRIH